MKNIDRILIIAFIVVAIITLFVLMGRWGRVTYTNTGVVRYNQTASVGNVIRYNDQVRPVYTNTVRAISSPTTYTNGIQRASSNTTYTYYTYENPGTTYYYSY